jgi:hypothetical protein
MTEDRIEYSGPSSSDTAGLCRGKIRKLERQRAESSGEKTEDGRQKVEMGIY